MANLRTLLELDVPSYVQQSLAVWNTNIDSVSNGGRCCLWCVPPGVNTATFEIVGGGGDGAGACCCQWGKLGGGAGGYTEVTIRVTPGCCYRICAGGSGCCSQNCCGTCGFPSWVECANAGGMVGCACGGCGGIAFCFWHSFNCTGICCIACGANINCGYRNGEGYAHSTINSPSKTSNWCGTNQWHNYTGAPKYGGSTRRSMDVCATMAWMGCCWGAGGSRFPGGGGGGAGACGGPCCWGGWGNGGLVVVKFST